jgi:hypothetical protein
MNMPNVKNMLEASKVIVGGGGGYTYVREQPNIDDLICAGMSSGPANRT